MSEISSSQRVLLLRELNGELKWFSNGDVKIWIRVFWKMYTNGKYVGEITNGEPDGNGTLTLSNGEKYVGEWKDGKRNGQGTVTSPEGYKYVGEWKDGQMDGQGTETLPDGAKYIGEWKNGKSNGQGTFTFGKGKYDGEKSVGEYKDGKTWNVITYDKYGNIKYMVVNGKMIKQ